MKPSNLTILKTIALLCIIHAANAQQVNERGGPIRGLLIKGGRNPSGDVVVQARTISSNDLHHNKKEKIPTWYYLDAGTQFMGTTAANDLRLNNGMALNLGATIPFNQLIGLTIHGGASSFGNNSSSTVGVQNIKYTDGAGGVETLESKDLKKSEATSFTLLTGPNMYKNLGRFYIQPGILLGMHHLNHKGYELGEGTNFKPSPGENITVKTYQVPEFSKTSFALRPDFKLGYLLFRPVTLQASAAYTYIPKINYSASTFVPAYNPDPNGVHEFQSLQNGTYQSTNQSVNFSHWNISMGLSFTFNSKHAINTKGTGAQNNITSRAGRGKVKNIKVDTKSAKTSGNAENNPASQPDTATKSSIVPTKQQHAINTKGTGAQNIRTSGGGNNNPASQPDTATQSSIVPTKQEHAVNTKGTGAQNNRAARAGRGKVKNIKVDTVSAKTSGNAENNPASQADTATKASIVPTKQQHAINTKGTGAQNIRTSGGGNNPAIKTDSTKTHVENNQQKSTPQ